MMKIFYCVKSQYYRDGTKTAILDGSKRAFEKPDNTKTVLLHKDVYYDWFGSKREAFAKIKAVRGASR